MAKPDEPAYTATEQLDTLEKLIRKGWELKLDGMYIWLVSPNGVEGHRYMTLAEILNYATYERIKRFL